MKLGLREKHMAVSKTRILSNRAMNRAEGFESDGFSYFPN
jgi:hypothetical protein